VKKSKFDEAVELLDASHWSDRSKWLMFATACHAVGHMGVWDKHSQLHPGNHNHEQNMQAWTSVSSSCHESALKDVVPNYEAKHMKYKKTLADETQPDAIVGGNDQGKLGFELLKQGTNYVIQSDTGAGETTSFKQCLKDTGMPFVSVV
jgi:hypothetical protein